MVRKLDQIYRCSGCGEDKPGYVFYKTRDQQCRECIRVRSKRHYWNHQSAVERADRKSKQQAWRENNREWARWRHIFNTYGLTLDQFCALEEQQDFCCAICGDPLDQPHTDHNHRTRLVRGLLCRGCNIGLGSFRDTPAFLLAAAEYLRVKGNYAGA